MRALTKYDTPESPLRQYVRRDFHWTFIIIHILYVLAILVSTIGLEHHFVVFESGVLVLTGCVAGLLLASFDRKARDEDVPNSILVHNRVVWMSIWVAVANIGFSLFYLYNLIYLLAVRCPNISPLTLANYTATTNVTLTPGFSVEIMAQTMCIQDYAWMIVYVICLFLLIILEFFVIGYYASRFEVTRSIRRRLFSSEHGGSHEIDFGSPFPLNS